MINLTNQFHVALPVDDAWKLLTDLPRVARCMPGASLDEVVDEEYRGGLSTRIGPISAKYRGSASFREFDEVGHRAIISAHGREEKGSGSANALITAVLKDDGDGTLVDVSTELAISGRAAQFGRSLLAEVSNTMIDEFVRRLERMISGDTEETTSPDRGERAAPAAASSTVETAPEQLDVLTTIALPILKRFAAPIGAGCAGLLIGLVLGRGRRGSRQSAVLHVTPFSGHQWD